MAEPKGRRHHGRWRSARMNQRMVVTMILDGKQRGSGEAWAKAVQREGKRWRHHGAWHQSGGFGRWIRGRCRAGEGGDGISDEVAEIGRMRRGHEISTRSWWQSTRERRGRQRCRVDGDDQPERGDDDGQRGERRREGWRTGEGFGNSGGKGICHGFLEFGRKKKEQGRNFLIRSRRRKRRGGEIGRNFLFGRRRRREEKIRGKIRERERERRRNCFLFFSLFQSTSLQKIQPSVLLFNKGTE